ncbi:MAG: hypothetical protein OEU84_07740 [Xanthomonadales bacterium]|nr:hypothetical protein [Xanthomonadales bacterium]
MKKRFRVSKILPSVLAFIGALTIASTASAKNPKEVKMTINSNKLVITSPKNENDCQSIAENNEGCIKVKKNKKSKIYFQLTGDTKCSLANGTNWELNAVYLGGYDSPSKPGSFGFDSTSDDNWKKVESDFTVTNRTSGEVKTIEKSAKKIGINNENQNAYVVWYKIEAICKRSDGNAPYVTTSDPRVRNDGTD